MKFEGKSKLDNAFRLQDSPPRANIFYHYRFKQICLLKQQKYVLILCSILLNAQRNVTLFGA